MTTQPVAICPLGGFRNSGTGREEGIDEMLSFTEEKAIHVML